MMICIFFSALFNQFSNFTATGPPPLWAMVTFNGLSGTRDDM